MNPLDPGYTKNITCASETAFNKWLKQITF